MTEFRWYSTQFSPSWRGWREFDGIYLRFTQKQRKKYNGVKLHDLGCTSLKWSELIAIHEWLLRNKYIHIGYRTILHRKCGWLDNNSYWCSRIATLLHDNPAFLRKFQDMDMVSTRRWYMPYSRQTMKLLHKLFSDRVIFYLVDQYWLSRSCDLMSLCGFLKFVIYINQVTTTHTL